MVPRNVLFAAFRDDAENMKQHFVVSRECVTVQRSKGLNALLSAICNVEC